MLNQILALTQKDLKVFFKDGGAVITIFLMPFMFIVVMSTAMSGMFGSSEDRPIRLLAVNQDRGSQAATMLQQLDEMKAFAVETNWNGQPLTGELAEEVIKQGKRSLALIFPPEFSESLEQGPTGSSPGRTQTTRIVAIVDPAASSQFVEPILGTLQGLLERAMFTAMIPQGIDFMFEYLSPQAPAERLTSFKTDAQQALSGGLVDSANPVASIERKAPAGMQIKKFPDVFQQNVPGYTIFGIFWIVSLLASSVLQEKRDGTFRRVLVAPMSRGVMLAGKTLPYYIINLLQITIMLGAARLLFGMGLGSSPDGLIVISLAAAAMATGLGVLVSAIARTEAQVGGLTTLLLLTMSALGGSFIPRFAMPEWLQTVGLMTPHAWALDAYQDLLVRGYGLAEVMLKVGVMAAFAAVFFVVGVWRFKFE